MYKESLVFTLQPMLRLLGSKGERSCVIIYQAIFNLAIDQCVLVKMGSVPTVTIATKLFFLGSLPAANCQTFCLWFQSNVFFILCSYACLFPAFDPMLSKLGFHFIHTFVLKLCKLSRSCVANKNQELCI